MQTNTQDNTGNFWHKHKKKILSVIAVVIAVILLFIIDRNLNTVRLQIMAAELNVTPVYDEHGEEQPVNIPVEIRSYNADIGASDDLLYYAKITATIYQGELKAKWTIPFEARKRATYTEICARGDGPIQKEINAYCKQVDTTATNASPTPDANYAEPIYYNKISCTYFIPANSTGLVAWLSGWNRLGDPQRVGCANGVPNTAGNDDKVNAKTDQNSSGGQSGRDTYITQNYISYDEDNVDNQQLSLGLVKEDVNNYHENRYTVNLTGDNASQIQFIDRDTTYVDGDGITINHIGGNNTVGINAPTCTTSDPILTWNGIAFSCLSMNSSNSTNWNLGINNETTTNITNNDTVRFQSDSTNTIDITRDNNNIKLGLSNFDSGNGSGNNSSYTASNATCTTGSTGQLSLPKITIDAYGRATIASTNVIHIRDGFGITLSPDCTIAANIGDGLTADGDKIEVKTGNGLTINTGDGTVAINAPTCTTAAKFLTWTGTAFDCIDLATSGVTAATCGTLDTTAVSGYGGSFSIPQLSVDTYGRVTGLTCKVITMPEKQTLTMAKSGNNYTFTFDGVSIGTVVDTNDNTTYAISKGNGNQVCITPSGGGSALCVGDNDTTYAISKGNGDQTCITPSGGSAACVEDNDSISTLIIQKKNIRIPFNSALFGDAASIDYGDGTDANGGYCNNFYGNFSTFPAPLMTSDQIKKIVSVDLFGKSPILNFYLRSNDSTNGRAVICSKPISDGGPVPYAGNSEDCNVVLCPIVTVSYLP